MKPDFEPGLATRLDTEITESMLATLDGEPVFPVLPTAELIRLMELTCRKLIQPYLDEQEEALGVEASIEHLATCGVGKTVRTTAEVADFRHNQIRFHTAAFDAERLLATGVQVQRVLSRAQAQAAFAAGCLTS